MHFINVIYCICNCTTMKKNPISLAVTALLFLFVLSSCNVKKKEENKENDRYDGPAAMALREWNRTKDPATGMVPRNNLVPAMAYAEHVRGIVSTINAAGVWTERGPNSDTVGASNGNTRANSGVTSGRVRAVMVDANDASGNTVWVGGVNGGIWKTTNITLSPATWTPQSDFYANMAVTSICQNPSSPQTMYFATGEAFYNADAVAGDGIWKSTNGGASWLQLASTTGTSFDYCSKILCDNSGNLYVATRSGVFRSTDGGANFTTVTPTTGLSTSRFSDMELSSTGRLHVSAGVFSTCGYRYTDAPSTVTSTTWTSPTSGYPTSSVRIELACSGNTLIALPSDASYMVPSLYVSVDGGATWAATGGNPTSGWATGQAWYALAADIDPSNSNNMVVGGLEAYKTTDGGATWTRISRWVGTSGQYVHADIHFIDYYSSNRILFGCDGGIHYSSDGGTTIRDRNVGLRIKQFYSCDFHPSTTDYFLAGAQDNGCHRFRTGGLAGSTEVIGGDGGLMRIDQNEPSYQFGSYVYNVYRRSINSGANWSTCTFYKGSPGTYNLNYFDFGDFINPYDYDNTNNILYGAADADEYFRWTTPQTTAAGTYYSNTNFATANAAIVPLTGLGGGAVSNVFVSPYTNNRVYFGGSNGRVVYVDGANSASAPTTAGTNITGASFPSGTVSCINVGTNDNNLMACFSNYNVNNIWVTTNGGTSWTTIDGNLPNIPVRWCMFYPGDNTRAIIATEAGTWVTELINGASTSWYVSSTFPLVRTDMLRYRPSDNMLVAATHGRGLWTQSATSIFPLNEFLLSGSFSDSRTDLKWTYEMASSQTKFEIQSSTNGVQFSKAGDAVYNGSKRYSFTHIAPSSKMYYRIRAIEQGQISRYSNIIKLDRSRAFTSIDLLPVSPNPVGNAMMLQYSASATGQASFDIMDAAHRTVLSRKENVASSGAFAIPWNVDKLKTGTYMLVMRMNGLLVSQKMVKQ
jgi:trimeric autotransporter adhesin